MTNDLGKYLLLIYDMVDCSQLCWETELERGNFGHMNWQSFKIDEHMDRLLNNKKLHKYLTTSDGILYLDKATIYDTKIELNKAIQKLKNSYSGDGGIATVSLPPEDIFDEIYLRFDDKLNKDEINILFLAAYHHADIGFVCTSLCDILEEDEKGSYLSWLDGVKERINW